MERLDGIMVLVSRTLNKVSAYIVLPAMAAMMTVDVILRYVFNAPLSWGLEASQYMLLIVFVFGMLEAFRTGSHVRMELVYQVLPGAARRFVTLVYGVVTIAVFVALVRKGAEEATFLHSIGEVTQYLHMPRWMFAAAITVVAGLIVVFFLLRGLEVLRARREVVEDGGGHLGSVD